MAHGSKVAPDDDLRRSATVLAKATGTNFGTDAIGAIMAKYDTDGDGKFDLNEVRGIAADVLTQKAGKKAYKGIAIASFFLLLAALVAMFGVSFLAGEVLKDTEATNSTLATRDGSVLKTSPATRAMPLLVAPVLELAQLEKMQTMTVSYLDPINNDTKVTAVLGLTGAKKISDTKRLVRRRLAVGRVRRDLGRRRVHRPYRCRLALRRSAALPARPLARPPARSPPPVLPSPGGVVRVCEADVTCSALKVDDTADADALLEAAAAALTAAGHGEKMAARERRLADCTMSDSMALGFALAIARLTQQGAFSSALPHRPTMDASSTSRKPVRWAINAAPGVVNGLDDPGELPQPA